MPTRRAPPMRGDASKHTENAPPFGRSRPRSAVSNGRRGWRRVAPGTTRDPPGIATTDDRVRARCSRARRHDSGDHVRRRRARERRNRRGHSRCGGSVRRETARLCADRRHTRRQRHRHRGAARTRAAARGAGRHRHRRRLDRDRHRQARVRRRGCQPVQSGDGRVCRTAVVVSRRARRMAGHHRCCHRRRYRADRTRRVQAPRRAHGSRRLDVRARLRGARRQRVGMAECRISVGRRRVDRARASSIGASRCRSWPRSRWSPRSTTTAAVHPASVRRCFIASAAARCWGRSSSRPTP